MKIHTGPPIANYTNLVNLANSYKFYRDIRYRYIKRVDAAQNQHGDRLISVALETGRASPCSNSITPSLPSLHIMMIRAPSSTCDPSWDGKTLVV